MTIFDHPNCTNNNNSKHTNGHSHSHYANGNVPKENNKSCSTINGTTANDYNSNTIANNRTSDVRINCSTTTLLKSVGRSVR